MADEGVANAFGSFFVSIRSGVLLRSSSTHSVEPLGPARMSRLLPPLPSSEASSCAALRWPLKAPVSACALAGGGVAHATLAVLTDVKDGCMLAVLVTESGRLRSDLARRGSDSMALSVVSDVSRVTGASSSDALPVAFRPLTRPRNIALGCAERLPLSGPDCPCARAGAEDAATGAATSNHHGLWGGSRGSRAALVVQAPF